MRDLMKIKKLISKYRRPKKLKFSIEKDLTQIRYIMANSQRASLN